MHQRDCHRFFALLALVTGLLLYPLVTLAADAGYAFTTLAGVAGALVSSADGTGSAAQFSAPRGLAVDSAGNVYVADSSNHTIRKITAAGVVTTLAGTAGSSGNTNGTGAAARFNEPFAVAVDSAGNVFVADTNNNAIRKITPSGVVTTLAGGSGPGTNDGVGTAAKLHEPRGIAIDSSGTLYVADYENELVRKVTSDGTVTTLAGGANITGNTNGQGTAARFMSLQGIALDSAGNIYVTDSGNRAVRKITASGLVTTLIDGSNGVFGAPRGIAVDASGNLYVGDYSANAVNKITSAGAISTFAGTKPIAGSTDGTGTSALFNGVSGMAFDSAGNLYVADTLNNTIRKISSTGVVTTFAGLAGRTSSVDGSATTARFEDPYAIAADGSGNLYVADATDHSIRKITSDGTVSTFAGKGGSFGSTDATGADARFRAPLGIAADSAGNVYVADTGNATVRKITPTGVVTTLAGSAGQGGSADGTGSSARFMSPYGITVDGSGTVYVVESSAVVRKITASGVVTTLAGTSGTNGFTDATGTAARFSVPFDIAVDGSGTLYVSDHGNHAVRKVTAAGVVTTLAGSGSGGKADGTGTAASFKFPSGIAADSAGNVYLADTDNQVIRKITSAGVVTTIGGTGSPGSADGSGTAASFYNPKDVAVDASGNLYIVDRNNHTIRKGTLQSTTVTAVPVCTLVANPASIAAGSTATLTASCTPAASSHTWTGGTCAGTTAATCTVTPTSTTSYSVAGTNAGGTGTAASATVTVTVTTISAPVCTLSANPSSITAGGSSTLTATCNPAASSYIWTGGSCAGVTTASCTVSPTVTSTYTVQGSNAGGSNQAASATVTVTSSTTTNTTSYTVPGTLGNDVFVLTAANNYYGGGGNDTYIISPHTLRGDVTAKIIDSEGDNIIQLIDGMTVTASAFYTDAAQLTLSSGAKVQILGASKFKFQLGANALAGDTATVVTYSQFVSSLGASLTAGTLPASGTAGYVVPTGFTQAAAPTPAVAGTAYTVPGTLGDDVLVPSGGNNYLGGGGNDTYVISPYTLSGTVTAKIIDTEGANVIQLTGGLTIASSSFFSNAVQLTLSNGATVQILGASGFSYQLGANAPAGVTASSLGYPQFATTLGASVPTGAAAVSGSANFVVPGG